MPFVYSRTPILSSCEGPRPPQFTSSVVLGTSPTSLPPSNRLSVCRCLLVCLCPGSRSSLWSRGRVTGCSFPSSGLCSRFCDEGYCVHLNKGMVAVATREGRGSDVFGVPVRKRKAPEMQRHFVYLRTLMAVSGGTSAKADNPDRTP